jgi:hypothetical protein
VEHVLLNIGHIGVTKVNINSFGTDSDFCYQGQDTEIAQKSKIVEMY